MEPMLAGEVLCFFLLFDVPRNIAELPIEFSVLSCEVLMMKVYPIVFWKTAIHHLIVENNVVWNFSVSKYQGDGIIPRLFRFWRVHGNPWVLLQFHHVIV